MMSCPRDASQSSSCRASSGASHGRHSFVGSTELQQQQVTVHDFDWRSCVGRRMLRALLCNEVSCALYVQHPMASVWQIITHYEVAGLHRAGSNCADCKRECPHPEADLQRPPTSHQPPPRRHAATARCVCDADHEDQKASSRWAHEYVLVRAQSTCLMLSDADHSLPGSHA